MSDPVAPVYPESRVPSIKRVTTPQDANLMGTVFGGAILSEIDLAAAIEAHKLHPGHVVTVAMDKVEFKRPIFVGDLVSLFTEVVRLGRSSITVRVTVWAQRRQSPRQTVAVTEALVTMVAVDDSLHPVAVGEGDARRPGVVAPGGPGAAMRRSARPPRPPAPEPIGPLGGDRAPRRGHPPGGLRGVAIGRMSGPCTAREPCAPGRPSHRPTLARTAKEIRCRSPSRSWPAT